jgi:hypothetical protein
MARQRKGRMLRENCLESKKLATATHAACNLWFRLLVKVDDYGNFLDDPAVIKTACFLWRAGMKNSFVKELIDELQSVGLLSRYEVNNERFIHIERFEDFQELRYEKVARFPRLLEPGHPPTEVSTPPCLPPQDFPVVSTPLCPPAKSNTRNKSLDEVKSKRSEGKAAPSPVWKETGVNPLSVPGPFRKLCEDFWPTRSGASLFDFMGSTLDAWAALGNKGYPPAWVRRKSEIGRSSVKDGPRLPELEDIPWQK